MPTITKGDKVLVTGANGYIATWAIRIFLERGYSVRGTVRSEGKAKDVKDYFNSIGLGEKLETFIVDDIVKVWLTHSSELSELIWSQEGAFDEAVKDVDGIAHMASPFHGNVKDPQGRPSVSVWIVHLLTCEPTSEFFQPAIQGTVGILKSAHKHGYV